MRLTQLLPVLVSAAVLVSARTNLTNPLWKEDDVETIDLSDIVAAKLKAGELDLAPSNISSVCLIPYCPLVAAPYRPHLPDP